MVLLLMQLCDKIWFTYGISPIFLSYSNTDVLMLLQESDSCVLSGAVSLCNPFNLVIADEDLRKGFKIVYNKALANGLRKIFKK